LDEHQSDLRASLDVLRRHSWLIFQTTIALAVAAALLTALRTPVYQATSRVLLRPNDPSEQIGDASNAARSAAATNLEQYSAAQADIVKSRPVAEAAAQDLNGNKNAADALLGQVSVNRSTLNNVLSISARDIAPAHARDVANAFAHAYIDNRKDVSVANLKQASDEIGTKLADLQTRIATLDSRIGDGGIQQGGSSTPQAGRTRTQTSQPAPPTPQVDNSSIADLGGQPTTLESLKAARYAAAVQYEDLFSQQQQIQVNITLQRGGAEMISEARTPGAPSSPGPVRNGILGGIVGFLLGIGLAFLRERLNTKLRSREEAERITGLATLAELPVDPDSLDGRHKVPALAHTESAVAEAVRSLRVSIGFSALDTPLRRLVVTSPQPQDGKSFVAANLAVVYATAGYRTILVQADLRRPAPPEPMLGTPDHTRSMGLTGVLAAMAQLDARHGNGHGDDPIPLAPQPQSTARGASATIRQALSRVSTREDLRRAIESELLPTVEANLQVLPAGLKPPNPAEVLGSPLTDELLRQLTSMVDMVIIDTPPVLAVADPVILAKKADAVILVASVGKTERHNLERAKTTLDASHARLLGITLNRIKKHGSYYYSGYYGPSEEPSPRWARLIDRLRRKNGDVDAEEQPSEEPAA
jgi:non-specific protein-tyrosine kinase